MFGSAKPLPPEKRERCIDYVRAIFGLAARQDVAASAYNTAVVKAGAAVSGDLLAASAELLHVAIELERTQIGLPPVPEEAASVYLAWQQTWLDYRAWCEIQAAVLAAGEGVTSTAVTENRRLLDAAERSRRQAEKLEGQLLKRIRPDAAMLQDWMKSLYKDEQ